MSTSMNRNALPGSAVLLSLLAAPVSRVEP